MRRYIDADKLQEVFKELHGGKRSLLIDTEPTADVRENVRGEWIPVISGRGGFECSKCHGYAPSYQNGDEHLSHYCPNCGADMRTAKQIIHDAIDNTPMAEDIYVGIKEKLHKAVDAVDELSREGDIHENKNK